jgi:hypothetical protein
MSISIGEPSRRELELATQLRLTAEDEIMRRGITDDELAQELGMLPVGVQVLRRRSTWPLAVAIRVAAALELEISLETRSAV